MADSREFFDPAKVTFGGVKRRLRYILLAAGAALEGPTSAPVPRRRQLSKGLLAAMPRQLDKDRMDFSIMIYAYPCRLVHDEDGEVAAMFPDVPEAITGGRDRTEALALAEDALAVALAGYIRAKRDIPDPGETACGLVSVSVPVVVAAKLALYSVMRSQGVTKVELALRLGVSESAVRRLADPDHRSHIDHVERALRQLGCTATLEVAMK